MKAFKDFAWSVLRTAIDRAPRRVREAILETCLKSFGPVEVAAWVLPRLHIVELGVAGDLGLIRSAGNDRFGLLHYALTGGAEAGIVREIEAFFAGDSGTYIDVGANIGLTTIPIARMPQVRCIAFEPEPGNFHFLKLNVETNVEGHAVEFRNEAVFHERATVTLAIADANLGDHRVTTSGIPGRRSVEVAAVPLDDVLDRVVGKLAVKIDTQGAEPSVIAGGSRLLARAGLVAVEFCPFLMRQLGGDPLRVVEFIGEFDRVAVTDGGVETTAVFIDPAEAQQRMRAKLRTARDTDADYLDIVARRGA